jgi:hypothetical protein
MRYLLDTATLGQWFAAAGGLACPSNLKLKIPFGFRISGFGFPSAFGFRPSDFIGP